MGVVGNSIVSTFILGETANKHLLYNSCRAIGFKLYLFFSRFTIYLSKNISSVGIFKLVHHINLSIYTSEVGKHLFLLETINPSFQTFGSGNMRN